MILQIERTDTDCNNGITVLFKHNGKTTVYTNSIMSVRELMSIIKNNHDDSTQTKVQTF